jgi:hypothetical protein
MDPVGVFPPPPLRTETDPVSKTLCSLVFRIPDDGRCPKSLVILTFFKQIINIYKAKPGVIREYNGELLSSSTYSNH